MRRGRRVWAGMNTMTEKERAEIWPFARMVFASSLRARNAPSYPGL